MDAISAGGQAVRPNAVLDRPRSASHGWVGFAGVVVALAMIVLLRGWLQSSWLKTLTVLGTAGMAMLVVDIWFGGTLRSPTRDLAERPLRSVDAGRVARKLLGFWLTLAALGAAYWLLPVYADSSFDAFREAALACLPALLVVAPFYVAYVDCRQRDPDDAYAQLLLLLAGIRPTDWNVLRTHALGWLVKGFFLPLMFSFANSNLQNLWSTSLPALDNFGQIFDRLIDLFYLMDVLLAGIAYVVTLRLFDTHIRSVEPSVAGWAVCLLCYPPFNQVTGAYLPYDQDNLYWGRVFAGFHPAYVLWGTTILALVFIYAWSTAAFGLRFSNLTNRGIITSGPYRWSKHPAYLSKNLSWWLISVPFIAGAGWQQAVQSCLLLAGFNGIYFLRARIEERHLSQDPAYRDYAAFIARHGLLSHVFRQQRSSRVANGTTSDDLMRE